MSEHYSKGSMSSFAIQGLPSTFRARQRGACVAAALLIAETLVDSRDYVVQGWIHFGADRFPKYWHSRPDTWHQHTWLEINGIMYDPTFAQFRNLPGYKKHDTVIYEVKDKIDIRIAMRYRLEPEWHQRIADFGGFEIQKGG